MRARTRAERCAVSAAYGFASAAKEAWHATRPTRDMNALYLVAESAACFSAMSARTGPERMLNTRRAGMVGTDRQSRSAKPVRRAARQDGNPGVAIGKLAMRDGTCTRRARRPRAKYYCKECVSTVCVTAKNLLIELSSRTTNRPFLIRRRPAFLAGHGKYSSWTSVCWRRSLVEEIFQKYSHLKRNFTPQTQLHTAGQLGASGAARHVSCPSRGATSRVVDKNVRMGDERRF